MRDSLLPMLRCPRCKSALTARTDALTCTSCKTAYGVRDGVPSLVAPESPLFASIAREQAAASPTTFGTDAHRQRDYWEMEETPYREVGHPVVEGFSRQRWDHLARRLDLASIHTALDVGAGNGFSTVYAPPHMRLVATDGSWRMLSKHPGEDRVLADATALPFADASFDLVFCWELSHHVNEPWRALQEMARVSSRYVLFFEPNPWNVAQAAFSVVDREHRWVLRFSRKYTLDQVRRAGLKPIRYERVGLIFPNKTPAPLFEVLKRLPFRIPVAGISQLVIAARA